MIEQSTFKLPDIDASDRIVFVERPRCPRCKATNAKTTRSNSNGDGSRTQRKRCRVCDLAFVLVIE